jgi:hypothetical protein
VKQKRKQATIYDHSWRFFHNAKSNKETNLWSEFKHFPFSLRLLKAFLPGSRLLRFFSAEEKGKFVSLLLISIVFFYFNSLTFSALVPTHTHSQGGKREKAPHHEDILSKARRKSYGGMNT